MITIYQWIADPALDVGRLSTDSLGQDLLSESFTPTTRIKQIYNQLRWVFEQIDNPRVYLRAGLYRVESLVQQWNDGSLERFSSATAVLCVIDKGGRIDWAEQKILQALGITDARMKKIEQIAEKIFQRNEDFEA